MFFGGISEDIWNSFFSNSYTRNLSLCASSSSRVESGPRRSRRPPGWSSRSTTHDWATTSTPTRGCARRSPSSLANLCVTRLQGEWGFGCVRSCFSLRSWFVKHRFKAEDFSYNMLLFLQHSFTILRDQTLFMNLCPCPSTPHRRMSEQPT